VELPRGAATGSGIIAEFHDDHALPPAHEPIMSGTGGVPDRHLSREFAFLRTISMSKPAGAAMIEDMALSVATPVVMDSVIGFDPPPHPAYHATEGDGGEQPIASATGLDPAEAELDVSGATRPTSGDTEDVSTGSTGAPGDSVDGVANGPVVLHGNRPPEYPPEARRRGQSGRVVLRVTIETDGTVSEAMIARSSGYEALDAAALRAVRTWKFTPAHVDGAAIRSGADVPVEFVLRTG